MSATVQHAAIEALVSIWKDTLTFPVFDGPTLAADDEHLFMMVGYDPISNDAEAASAQQSYTQIGRRSKQEDGTIRCTIAAWSGDETTTERRRQVAQALSDAEAAIRADITLGNVVMYANFGPRSDLNQLLTEGGNQVYARFDVAYTARI